MKKRVHTGDRGKAELPDGTWATKGHIHFDAVGTIDELSAALGLARAACDEGDVPLAERICEIQHDLVTVGSAIHLRSEDTLEMPAAKTLDEEIDAFWARMEPLEKFVIPGGCELAARLDVARTVCRRAERVIVQLNELPDVTLGVSVLTYLNRLSDWLFSAARLANVKHNIPRNNAD